MVKVKVQSSTQEELTALAKALKSLGIIQRGTIKGDGFSLNARFASTDIKKNDD